MMFKPPKKIDDIDRIKYDIAHDVKIGSNATVSLGGMRQGAVKVIFIGKDGITGEDNQGRRYHFLWEHVIAPTKEETSDLKQAAEHEPMAKSFTLMRELRYYTGLYRRV